jgi:threonine aldolase
MHNMTDIIDLRSDTITRPTAAMRTAMAEAPVGDDVLGDDPTVARLEQATAEVLGKEAAVFMPSGTMTNQVALRAHTQSGDEIVCDANAHCYYYEAGGPAALAGLSCRLVEAQRGIFTPDQLRAVLRPDNIHFPPTRLVVIENTHNRGGGAVWSIEQIAAVEAVAREAGLAMHMDGARLWNASAASGVAACDYASHFDSVSVCFSKGLGAPVGSALAGSAEFIARARRVRKLYGGGMRQAGIIAAGALHALEHHRQRLVDDHAAARALAQGLAAMPGLEIDPASVETNIAIFAVRCCPAAEFVQRLARRGVLMLATGSDTVRAVTSLAVSPGQIDQALETVAAALAKPLGD